MRIAIVIPAFNVAKFIREAILSVLAQTHADWRLIVVDDGSSDGTVSAVRTVSDPRIMLVRQANAGVSAARNRGISFFTAQDLFHDPRGAGWAEQGGDDSRTFRTALRRGWLHGPDAFLFLDGDDWLAPDALEVLAAALCAAPWAVAACGCYARVTMTADVCPGPRAPDGCVLEKLLIRNLFANGGHVLIRREAVQVAGGFRADLLYGEDWDYWARIAALGEFTAATSRSPLLFVRERLGSACQSYATDPAAYQHVIDVIYGNIETLRGLGLRQVKRLRQRADAEAAWAVGRELIRHGNRRAGRKWLRRSIRAAPNLKRLILIALSWFGIGPFQAYPTIG